MPDQLEFLWFHCLSDSNKRLMITCMYHPFSAGEYWKYYLKCIEVIMYLYFKNHSELCILYFYFKYFSECLYFDNQIGLLLIYLKKLVLVSIDIT